VRSCVCVCARVCVCACVCTSGHVHTCTVKFASTGVHVCFKCVRVCSHVFVLVCIHMCTCIKVHATCMHVHKHNRTRGVGKQAGTHGLTASEYLCLWGSSFDVSSQDSTKSAFVASFRALFPLGSVSFAHNDVILSEHHDPHR